MSKDGTKSKIPKYRLRDYKCQKCNHVYGIKTNHDGSGVGSRCPKCGDTNGKLCVTPEGIALFDKQKRELAEWRSVLPESKLVKKQVKTETVYYTSDNVNYRLVVEIRFDDECGNGHNNFAITAFQHRKNKYNNWVEDVGGCCHELIVELFPKFEKYIKWHLTSTDGPMYYIENTLYHVKENKLVAARSCAVWPDAELEDFTEEKLKERLPDLMKEFYDDIISLGFEY